MKTQGLGEEASGEPRCRDHQGEPFFLLTMSLLSACHT